MIRKYYNIAKGLFYASVYSGKIRNKNNGVFVLNLFRGGQIKKRIGLNSIKDVKVLRIRGILNINDIYFIQYMDNLEVLDLSKAVYIRKKHDEKGKLKLRKNLLKRKRCLSVIHLPEFIGYIPNHFFSECQNIERVIISKSVKIIGEHSFSFSGIKEIVIPESVKRIDPNAFDNCKDLEKVIIKDSKKYISWKGVQFNNCPSLRFIHIGRNSKFYDSLISHNEVEALSLGKYVNNMNFDFPNVRNLICCMENPPSVSIDCYKKCRVKILKNYDSFWLHPKWNKIIKRNRFDKHCSDNNVTNINSD